jgi:hypothetical protein
MSSNERATTYSRDTVGPYYTDKNNKKYYFQKDDKGYHYKDEKSNKKYYPRDDKGYYCPDIDGNKTYITYTMTELDKTYTSIKSNGETDINPDNMNLNKLSTYLAKELCSAGHANVNISLNDIKNTIKAGLKKYTNPESSKCKAIMSNGYICGAPAKFGSEYCRRKHKK